MVLWTNVFLDDRIFLDVDTSHVRSLNLFSSSKNRLQSRLCCCLTHTHTHSHTLSLFSSSKTYLNSLFLILVAMAAIFSNKRLTRSDIVHSKMTVPAIALPYFMGILQERNYTDLPVIDWTGQVWHFRIYTCPNDNKRGPVFTSGWPQFVRAKGLGEGDEVSFSVNQDGDGGLPYQILVHRPLQRFSLSGEPIIRDWDFNERASIALPDPAAPAPFYHFI